MPVLAAFTPAHVARALDGDPTLAHALLSELSRVVTRRVRRTLWIRRGSAGLAHADDLAQDALAALLERDGRRLRAWDPARGASLGGFVDRITFNLVQSWLRSPRRGWLESACDPEVLGEVVVSDDANPERAAGARELVDRVLDRIHEALDTRERMLFQALVVDEVSIEELSGSHGLSTGALYVRRCRLRRLARDIARDACSADLALAA